MRRIKYADLPPDERAEFDRARESAARRDTTASTGPSPEERKLPYWANEIRAGRAVMERGGPRGGWCIVRLVLPEPADEDLGAPVVVTD
jgi:hypothetical protein